MNLFTLEMVLYRNVPLKKCFIENKTLNNIGWKYNHPLQYNHFSGKT